MQQWKKWCKLFNNYEMVFSRPNFPPRPPFEIWMHLLCNCDSLSDGCRAACLSDDRENKLQNHIVGDHLLTYPDLCESDSPSKEWQDIFVPLLPCCLLLVCSQRSVTALPKALRFLFWYFIIVRFKVIQNGYVRLLCCVFLPGAEHNNPSHLCLMIRSPS